MGDIQAPDEGIVRELIAVEGSSYPPLHHAVGEAQRQAEEEISSELDPPSDPVEPPLPAVNPEQASQASHLCLRDLLQLLYRRSVLFWVFILQVFLQDVEEIVLVMIRLGGRSRPRSMQG